MSQKHRKLGRTSDQRRAMLRAMVTYLLENGQISAVGNHDELMKTSAIYQEVFYSQQKGGEE